MKLKNLDFEGFVFGQSGVQGFFGEGDEYPHHKWYKRIPGFSFKDIIFVAKTITFYPRIYPKNSNTKLYDEYKVKEMFPKSIWWSIRSIIKGYLVNAVGLANPGTAAMLSYYHKWQNRSDVFQISFMPMGQNTEEKIVETRGFCKFARNNMPFGNDHKYAIQLNLSCPNTGHDQKQDTSEAIAILSVFREMLPSVPIIPKFDLMIEPEAIFALKPFCDAFCIGNTLEVGKKPKEMNWKKLFKGGISPLLKHFEGRFKGGLSGAPLFSILVSWLEKMETHDPSVIIIAGGGILKKKNILRLSQFKIVHGVALGSVAIVRPWRLQSLIRYGNKIFSQKQKN